jgi:hypothetical protein
MDGRHDMTTSVRLGSVVMDFDTSCCISEATVCDLR